MGLQINGTCLGIESRTATGLQFKAPEAEYEADLRTRPRCAAVRTKTLLVLGTRHHRSESGDAIYFSCVSRT